RSLPPERSRRRPHWILSARSPAESVAFRNIPAESKAQWPSDRARDPRVVRQEQIARAHRERAEAENSPHSPPRFPGPPAACALPLKSSYAGPRRYDTARRGARCASTTPCPGRTPRTPSKDAETSAPAAPPTPAASATSRFLRRSKCFAREQS